MNPAIPTEAKIEGIKHLIKRYEDRARALRRQPGKTLKEHREALDLEDRIIPHYYGQLKSLGGSF